MYKLTNDPDVVLGTETGTFIPRGHRLWEEYESWLAAGNTIPLPEDTRTLSDIKEQLVAAATALRWEKETGGIELGGVRVGTTLDDQNRISGVLSAIALGGLAEVDFKAQNGWVKLTAAEIQGIAQYISAHVQACFSAERVHHEAIERLVSTEELATYDLTQYWPS
ncbi:MULTISPECIES: DUF4376 domain-containing protein [unclassified Stenotrophomonas]|uniref:DUF4376 domain-containing protein n=1 Tax=unclassified Stenotrophomonas TaxID=196198 RepID=UPI0021189553|nr:MULTISPECIES: DUF4376 domain-containing protein [unclassified Stenotrophomonas]